MEQQPIWPRPAALRETWMMQPSDEERSSPAKATAVPEVIDYLNSTITGEPEDPIPPDICPVLGEFARRLHQGFLKFPSHELSAVAATLVGTRSTSMMEQRRAYYCADSALRRFGPLALDGAGFSEIAAELRALAPVADVPTARAALKSVNATKARAEWTEEESAARYAALQQEKCAAVAIEAGLPEGADMLRAAQEASKAAWRRYPERPSLSHARMAVNKAQSAHRSMLEAETETTGPVDAAAFAVYLRVWVAVEAYASAAWTVDVAQSREGAETIRALALTTLHNMIALR
jgi:hypothetical protein